MIRKPRQGESGALEAIGARPAGKFVFTEMFGKQDREVGLGEEALGTQHPD